MGELRRNRPSALGWLRRPRGCRQGADRWQSPEADAPSAERADPSERPENLLVERLRSRASAFAQKTAHEQDRRAKSLKIVAATAAVAALTGGALVSIQSILPGDGSAVPRVAAAQLSTPPSAERFGEPAVAPRIDTDPSTRTAISADATGRGGPAEPVARPGRQSDQGVGADQVQLASLEQRFAPEAEPAVDADRLLTTGSVVKPAQDNWTRRLVSSPPADGGPLMAALMQRAEKTVGASLAGSADEDAAVDDVVAEGIPTPRPRPDDDVQVASVEPAADDAEAADDDTAATADDDTAAKAAAARILRSVNMRSRPDNGAGVITVLSKGSAVRVIDCDIWCKISANGRSGFVYKSFVKRSG